jgi:hypothetical protein
MQTLKERLREWSDIDCSMCHLAQALGMLQSSNRGPKWMYWSNNPTGNALYKMLQSLAELGVLEYREDGPTDNQFRWNPNYSPPS